MVLWVVLALMTGAAVLTVLWPLSSDRPREAESGTDLRFYRDQLAEIERDRARGLLAEREAEAARVEAGRRLLRAEAASPDVAGSTAEPALRRRRAASALALSVVPIVGLAVYGALGSPHLAARGPAVASGPAPAIDAALARMEAHLAGHPDDVRGWDLIAPIYLRLGRAEDAAKAYGQARRTGGDTVDRLLGHGEALVAAGQGRVPPEARAAFARALQIEPNSPRALFAAAALAEADGDVAAAARSYETMLAQAPVDAPWTADIRARLARLEASSTAMPADAVGPAIAAMVEGLDTRLRTSGGSEAEWARLVRSMAVLGRRDDALERLAKARAALAGDHEARSRLDRLAGELGLVVAAAPDSGR